MLFGGSVAREDAREDEELAEEVEGEECEGEGEGAHRLVAMHGRGGREGEWVGCA